MLAWDYHREYRWLRDAIVSSVAICGAFIADGDKGEEVEVIKRPVNSHKTYHAHVYYEQETLGFASSLCKEAGDLFNLRVGRLHQTLVGPHLKWSCQITFGSKDFDKLVPWLEQNRQDLTVFIHALSGNDLEDHTIYAYWLGNSVELDLSLFRA